VPVGVTAVITLPPVSWVKVVVPICESVISVSRPSTPYP
jgi:hypothetical protein